MRNRLIFSVLAACLLAFTASCEKKEHAETSNDQIVIGMPNYPKSLFFYLAGDPFTEEVNRLIFDSLIAKDYDTWKDTPALAKSWAIGPNTITVMLDERARFEDGSPVTAQDVKFTFDALMNPRHFTTPLKAYFHEFTACIVKDDHTVVFTIGTNPTRTPSILPRKFNTSAQLSKLNRFFVLPKARFQQGDFNRDFHQILTGSGPYRLSAVSGQEVVLEKRASYWGRDLPHAKDRYYFQKIRFRFIKENSIRFEALLKGDIDYLLFSSARQWEVESRHPKFLQHHILKMEFANHYPALMSGIAFNLQNPLFRDVRVREALSHLYNRERFNRDFFYHRYRLLTSYMGFDPELAAPTNPPIRYDPARAITLLKEAGWKGSEQEPNVLVNPKLGRKTFAFTLTFHTGSATRFLTVFQEDLEKVGIRMNLEQVDWPTLSRKLDQKSFDAVYAIWNPGVIPNLRAMWHSAEAPKEGSFNFMGYQNKTVDRLIEQSETAASDDERKRLCRSIDAILYRDHPVILGWARDRFYVGLWNKFDLGQTPFKNFEDWYQMIHNWRYNPTKEAALSPKTHAGDKTESCQ